MQIAVIGTDEFVTGFRLAGVNNVIVAEKNAEEKIDEVLGNPQVGVLVLEEDYFNSLNNRVKKKLEKLVKPVLVTVSDKGKETNIKEMIKRSLGVDLWK